MLNVRNIETIAQITNNNYLYKIFVFLSSVSKQSSWTINNN